MIQTNLLGRFARAVDDNQFPIEDYKLHEGSPFIALGEIVAISGENDDLYLTILDHEDAMLYIYKFSEVMVLTFDEVLAFSDARRTGEEPVS